MKKFTFAKARALFAGAVVALIVIGLLTHAATGTWSALGIESIAAICPVGALEVMLGSREFLLHPLILLLVVIAGVLLLGKAFCSWACPIPWLQKLFHPKRKEDSESKSVGRPIRDLSTTALRASGRDDDTSVSPSVISTGASASKRSGEIPCVPKASSPCAACKSTCSHAALPAVGGKRDGFQLDTRHFTLIGALGSAAIFGFPVFCLVCPIGLTVATFVGVFHLLQFNETSWGLLLFPALLLVEIVLFRKWCTKICPISALLSLISNGNRTFRPRVDNEKCLRAQGVDCHACTNACPELLDPHSRHIPECIKCCACMEACPEAAIDLRMLAIQTNSNRK